MNKLLVVDDDEAMRKVIRLNLADSYEVIDSGVRCAARSTCRFLKDPTQGTAV
jgi:hypothetical protein